MRQDTWTEAPCLFVDPGPQDPAPADANQSDHTIAMRQTKDGRADERRRKEPELAAQDRKEQSPKHEFFEKRGKDHVLEHTDHRQRARSPDEILIEPFGPMAGELPLFGRAIHEPLTPPARGNACKHRHHQLAEETPRKTT